MKRLMTFANDSQAALAQQELGRHGIKSRMVVDPLESIHPALSQFQDVVLMINDDSDEEQARRLVTADQKAC